LLYIYFSQTSSSSAFEICTCLVILKPFPVPLYRPKRMAIQ
jgi:hypothetical protein